VFEHPAIMDESEIDHHIFKSYIVISGLLLYIFLIMSVSHSGHAPTMTISDPQWENLQNSRVILHLF